MIWFTVVMTRLRSARERARAEIIAEILAEARRQLADVGAAGLSLRSVARELGMVSSAVYRYVESRDELLTRLIVETYDAIGEAAEAAEAASRGAPPAARFVAIASAVRRWAIAHPHEYALVHGSPVPGYAAPGDTIAPASRVPSVLARLVAESSTDVEGAADRHRDLADGERSDGSTDAEGISAGPADDGLPDSVRSDADRIVAELLPGVRLPPRVVVALIAAWAQMYGFISFEIFGQTKGAVTDHDALFRATTQIMASGLGLAGDAPGRVEPG